MNAARLLRTDSDRLDFLEDEAQKLYESRTGDATPYHPLREVVDAKMTALGLSTISRCIGCGCTDLRACHGGCQWLVVDLRARLGVCSNCGEHLPRWKAGDRRQAFRVKGRRA